MAAQADLVWAHAEVTTWLPGPKAVTKMEKKAGMNLPCTFSRMPYKNNGQFTIFNSQDKL